MTESRGSRQRRPRSQFVTQKQKTPPWIVAVFIGIPSVVAVILLVVLLKNLFTGAPPPPPEPENYAIGSREWDFLINGSISAALGAGLGALVTGNDSTMVEVKPDSTNFEQAF